MMRALILIPAFVSLALFASCTAINQKDAFLDQVTLQKAVPNPPETIFSDDFENGLTQWSQTSGTWITSTPGAVGSALQSPTSASTASFSISTAAYVNLASKTNCFLEYDAQYLIKGVSGVSATVMFDTTTVGVFKDTSGLTDITSSSAFVHRKAALPANGYGRISFLTTVNNNTSAYADLRIDNIKVTCGNAAATPIMPVYEDMESSVANWNLSSPWAVTAGAGYTSSKGIVVPTATTAIDRYTGSFLATYQPTVDLTGKYGCKLSFYYSEATAIATSCLYAEVNNKVMWSLCGNGAAAGNFVTNMTAFEGAAGNTLALRCIDNGMWLGEGVQCVIDEVKIACQQ